MWALTFHGPGDVRHEEVPDPRPVEPEDAVVRVEAAGLCGSDLHPWHGRETGLDRGTVLGHELAGTVEEVGPAVERFAPGDRVVAPFTTSCGECFYCRAGISCRCLRGQLFGWVEGGAGLHGAQAERVRVPLADATLVRLPPSVEPELALLAGDVLPTGLYGAELLGPLHPGATVAVVGCGPVGLAAVAALREAGAGTVLAVDRVAARLEAAHAMGAQPVDAGSDDPVEAARGATGGRGADGVVEAVGSPEASRLAFDLLRPGGTLAAVGVHTERTFPFSPSEAYDRNLTLRAGRCPARRLMEPSLGLLRSGRHSFAELITHRLPLSDGPAAYRMFAERRDGVVKVAFRPGR